MAAFNDATCKCGKRIGWVGEMKDRPPCPQCGHRPSDAELEETDRKLKEAEEKILRRRRLNKD